MGRRGRESKLLLDDCRENRRYCKLKEETLDRLSGKAMDLSEDRLHSERMDGLSFEGIQLTESR